MTKTPYKLRSKALLDSYKKIGKGGADIATEKLISTFNPIRSNDKKVMAEIRMISIEFNNHLLN